MILQLTCHNLCWLSGWKSYSSNSYLAYFIIKKSKTHQGRKRVKVFIGKTSDDLCPVTAHNSILSSIQRNRVGPTITFGVRNPTVRIQICGACTRWAQEGKTSTLRLLCHMVTCYNSDHVMSHDQWKISRHQATRYYTPTIVITTGESCPRGNIISPINS